MAQTRPISKTIATLWDLEERFNLQPTRNAQFFPKWQNNLPNLKANPETNSPSDVRKYSCTQ
ncbi:MAG: hypothetical protein LRZ84_03690 [Desertifilum sp.]|nr:hypothetical protein [Desertifilum sp.]MDI9641880.1 hypothetical protein [Geitlerinema splendidum]